MPHNIEYIVQIFIFHITISLMIPLQTFPLMRKLLNSEIYSESD